MNPDTPSYTTTGLLADLDRRPMIGMRALKKVIDNVLAANQGRIPPPSSPPRLGELTLHHRDSDLVSSHEALGDATVNLIASKLLVSNYDLSLPDFTVSLGVVLDRCSDLLHADAIPFTKVEQTTCIAGPFHLRLPSVYLAPIRREEAETSGRSIRVRDRIFESDR